MGTCYNTTVVDAPIDRVWATIRDFHDLGWAGGVVEEVERVGDKEGDEVGAVRVLNGAFHETLLSHDDEERKFSYSIDDGPGPVAADAVDDYVGRVRLLPVTDTERTFVEWTSTYDSDDPAAVGELCDPVYQALLQALKEHFQD